MPRHRSIAVAVIVLGLSLAAAPGFAQRDFSKVEIETQTVAPGIYMLKGAGGNIGVCAGEDGVLLVDAQFAPLHAKIRAAIAALTDESVRFVIDTHYHDDHVSGNEGFAKEGAVIVAHDAVRARLAREMQEPGDERRGPPPGPASLPILTFDDSLTLHLNGEDIVAVHLPPSHTDGDAIVLFRKANVVHMGDLFFNGLYPYIDVEAGGGIETMIAAIDRVLPAIGPQTKVIPGHGPLADRAALVAFRDMLSTVRDRVKPLVAAGKSLEDVRKAKPTADLDAKWGKGSLAPDVWLEMVYNGLVKH